MKKCLLFSAVLALLLSCVLPFGAFAEAEAQPVSTAAEFEAMSPTGSYYLTGDIDFGGRVFQNYILPGFSGTLDGRGFALLNFKIDSIDKSQLVHGGIFATVAEQGDTGIRNLQIGAPDAKIASTPAVNTGSKGFGMVAGAQANADHTLTLENVTVYADLQVGYTVYTDIHVGGLIGQVRNCVMNNCRMYGSVTGWTGQKVLHVGGLIGSLTGSAAKLNGCFNFADVTLYQTDTVRGGGIISYIRKETTVEIRNCMNFGDLLLTSEAFEGRRYARYAVLGGILGNTDGTNAAVDHCMNFGTLNNTSLLETGNVLLGSGGIVGWSGKANNYTNCVNYGVLKSTRPEDIGGLCLRDDTQKSNFAGSLDLTGRLSYSASDSLQTSGVQNSEAADGKFNVRFVGTVDRLDYRNVGFEITAYWQNAEGELLTKDFRVECASVYREILAKAETGLTEHVTAEALGGNYILALSVLNVPALADAGRVTFVARTFAETAEETLYGNTIASVYTAGSFVLCTDAQ